MSRMVPKAEYEAVFEEYGLSKTDDYKDGVRLWRKADGQLASIPEFDEIPEYIITKTLKEYGLFNIPLYTSNL